MYKTVRQGENSLQYTILPQTEEVLCNSGMKGKGRDFSPCIYEPPYKVMSMRRRLIFAACMTLFVLGIMCVSMATADYYIKKSLADYTARQAAERAITLVSSAMSRDSNDNAIRSKKKELRLRYLPATTSEIEPTSAEPAPPPPPTTAAPVASSTERRSKPAWSMPAFKLFWKTSTAAPSPPPVVEDEDEFNIPNGPFSRVRGRDREQAADVIIRPTVTVQPTTVPTQPPRSTVTPTEELDHPATPSATAQPKTTIGQDVLISTKWNEMQGRQLPTVHEVIEATDRNYPLGKDLKGIKDSILDSDEDDAFKELEVEMNSVPTPRDKMQKNEMLKKVREFYQKEMSETVSQEASEIPKMWPFGSSMPAFQWSNYTMDDSIIIPLMVGTATLLTIAVILTGVVARKRHKELARRISEITVASEVQSGDNANLLINDSQDEQ